MAYEDIINFIEEIKLPEDDLGNRVLINHLKKMSKLRLGLPRVALFNQPDRGNPKWEQELDKDDRKFINSPYQFSDQIALTLPKRLMIAKANVYTVRSVHLGNRDDEKLFLRERERNLIKGEIDRGPVSFDYICSEGRDFPGLIIYHFAVAVKSEGKQESTKLGHGRMPTLGYTISLPRSENLKGKTSKQIKKIVEETKHSYQVNKIHSQLQKLSAYEDYDDDE